MATVLRYTCIVCNAVRYVVGPLTAVCPPVQIIAAVCAIPTLSTICSSWLWVLRPSM